MEELLSAPGGWRSGSTLPQRRFWTPRSKPRRGVGNPPRGGSSGCAASNARPRQTWPQRPVATWWSTVCNRAPYEKTKWAVVYHANDRDPHGRLTPWRVGFKGQETSHSFCGGRFTIPAPWPPTARW